MQFDKSSEFCSGTRENQSSGCGSWALLPSSSRFLKQTFQKPVSISLPSSVPFNIFDICTSYRWKRHFLDYIYPVLRPSAFLLLYIFFPNSERRAGEQSPERKWILPSATTYTGYFRWGRRTHFVQVWKLTSVNSVAKQSLPLCKNKCYQNVILASDLYRVSKTHPDRQNK